MPNSFVTNLYPKPTKGVTDQTLSITTGTSTFSAFNSLTKYIALDVQDVDVRVTFDGSTPSTSNGHILYAGRAYTFSKAAAEDAIFARKASSGTAVIHASEFTD